MSDQEALPEPHDGMTPEEKGMLLQRYVAARRPVGRLSFRGAVLAGAELVDADFSRADLSGADLREAVLVDADLRLTKLDGANLRGANLMVACLDRTSLTDADMTDAILCGADLTRTRFTRATLRRCDMTLVSTFGADFTETNLIETRWGESQIVNSDLGTARLRGAALWAPCSIGHDVLARTYASVESGRQEEVERFLRACGVPDEILGYYRARKDASPITVVDNAISERLDELRDLLKAQTTNESDVREMLLDQGAAHVLAKDRRLLQTRVQRVASAVVSEVRRRTLGKLGDALQDEVVSAAGTWGKDDGEDDS